MLGRVVIAAVLLQGALVLAGPAVAPTTQAYTATTYDDACKQLRERGFPATMEDLQAQAIPDDKNGAAYLKRAAEAVVESGPRSSSLEYGPSLPYPRKWFELAEESEKANAAALDLVRKARGCGEQISWDMNAQLPPAERMQQILKGLSALRGLSNVVTDEALLEHFRGNDAAAFELGKESIYLVKANDRRPFLVSALVSGGVRALVAENYRLMAVNVRIADKSEDGGGKGVDRRVVKDAIAWLFDDAQIRDGMRRTMAEERVYGLTDAKANGIAANSAWQADLPAILALYDELASKMDLPPWKPLNLTSIPHGPYQQLYGTLTKSPDRWRDAMCKITLGQRMAAVSLAVALYHHDKGSYPKTIEELVPEYLPRLPIDPYSRSGEPLMYHVMADGKRPRLGSVGPDGVDAQLEDEEAPSQARYDLYFGRPGAPDDVWIDLAAWPPEAGK